MISTIIYIIISILYKYLALYLEKNFLWFWVCFGCFAAVLPLDTRDADFIFQVDIQTCISGLLPALVLPGLDDRGEGSLQLHQLVLPDGQAECDKC